MFEHEGMIYSSPPCRISYEMGLKASKFPLFDIEVDKSEMSRIDRHLLRLIALHPHIISKLDEEVKRNLLTSFNKTLNIKELIGETNKRI